MGLYEKLQRGQIVNVQVLNGERRFSIKTRQFGGLTGYIVLVDGKAVPEYAGGKILDRATVRDWCNHLVDLDEKETSCESDEHHDQH